MATARMTSVLGGVSTTTSTSTSRGLGRSAKVQMRRGRGSAGRAAPRVVAARAVEEPKQDVSATVEAEEEASVIEEKPTAAKEYIDPADGSVSVGAPMEDAGTVLLSNFASLFKGGKASEMINGRCAQIGFTVALYNEIVSGKSIFEQMFLVRETPLRDIWYPQAGAFLIPLTVLLVTVASFVPAFRGQQKNGLDVDAEDWGPFRQVAEVKNGRWAMVGLLALWLIEKQTGSALF